MWAATTACANWMMTELYTRDCRRNEQDKMPRMERVYLYPEARIKWPQLPSSSVASIEQTIQRKYRAIRYKVIWTAAASLPAHRYPIPFPVPSKSWSIEVDGESPVVTARIGERRFQLRLRGGVQYRRQLAAMRQMASGEAARGELAILRRKNAETGR